MEGKFNERIREIEDLLQHQLELLPTKEVGFKNKILRKLQEKFSNKDCKWMAKLDSAKITFMPVGEPEVNNLIDTVIGVLREVKSDIG